MNHSKSHTTAGSAPALPGTPLSCGKPNHSFGPVRPHVGAPRFCYSSHEVFLKIVWVII